MQRAFPTLSAGTAGSPSSTFPKMLVMKLREMARLVLSSNGDGSLFQGVRYLCSAAREHSRKEIQMNVTRRSREWPAPGSLAYIEERVSPQTAARHPDARKQTHTTWAFLGLSPTPPKRRKRRELLAHSPSRESSHFVCNVKQSKPTDIRNEQVFPPCYEAVGAPFSTAPQRLTRKKRRKQKKDNLLFCSEERAPAPEITLRQRRLEDGHRTTRSARPRGHAGGRRDGH